MAFSTGEEKLESDSRIAVSCSNCSYEFILKPLPSLLNSHSTRQRIIPDTEAIQTFISNAEGEVTRCSDEVSRLREIIEKVERHQAKLSHGLAVHRSFIAPIHRLPPELLALIFSFFCTVDFWDCQPFDAKCNEISGSVFREPFIIATVCSQWRSIALSTPSLWSTIMLGGGDIKLSKEDYYEAYNPGRRVELDLEETRMFPEDVLEVALQRSAQHSLKLWIECFESVYWPSIFTTKLRQACSRIEQIYLSGDLDPFHSPLISPNLVFDRLSAVRVRPYEDLRTMDRLPWLSTATNVRILILQRLGDSYTSLWNHLPAQSTPIRLFVEDENILAAISTFSKFPNVVSSGLMFQHSDYNDPLHWRSLQGLRHLRITMCCEDRQCAIAASTPHSGELEACNCFENLVPNLTLPALQSLHIECDTEYLGPRWSNAHFSDFIDRSAIKQSLTCLSIHNIDGLDDDEIVNIFQSFPFLTHLTVSTFNQKPIISTQLLEQLGSNTLLPRLRFFDIQIYDAIDAMIGFVDARTPSRGHLKEIVVHLDMEVLLGGVKRLEDGLRQFPGTRHSIFESRPSRRLSFDEWMDQVQESEDRVFH
ncbi:hypothetical protein C8J56DRAFT_340942 [Mycena floridula]|nr:hypothetical protein C8J56DRAFT_340942 [Mycena floridula]